MWMFLAALAVGSATSLPADPSLGRVEGELRFPSCSAPADLRVCAEDASSGARRCVQAPGGDRFSLDLPPGRYTVFATTAARPAYRAYFSEAVACGLTVDCNDHRPVTVEVERGRVTRGIDTADWFAAEGDAR